MTLGDVECQISLSTVENAYITVDGFKPQFLAYRCNTVHNMSSVVVIAMTKVFCDKTFEARITLFH